jgi:hypothetical protein
MEFGGDTIKKVAWSGLRARCNAELANVLDYSMWLLGARYGGTFNFSTSAMYWDFANNRFGSLFGFMVHIERDGEDVTSFGATAKIGGPMKWFFTLDLGDLDDLEQVGDFDFTAPADINRAADEIARCVTLQMRNLAI